MNYYEEIKNKLIDDEIYSRAKDYSKERHKVVTYFEIGRLLSEAGSKYGDDIIGKFSKKLTLDVGKKYTSRTLFRIRQFFRTFDNEKVSTAWTQLTWSHVRLLLKLDDVAINYYIRITIEQNISVRELEHRIRNNEHERLPEVARAAGDSGDSYLSKFVKNPILIKDNKNYEILSEKILQRLILEDIESFMKELGGAFCFIGSEYKVKLGGVYNYIDILLFNYKYNCFVVIELKTTELKKEHIGQIQFYMNYVDENLKCANHDKTIGIIICKQNNKYVIKYCSDDRIIAREYKLA